VFWSLVAVGAIGFALGLYFRAPALIMATLGIVVANVTVHRIEGFLRQDAILSTLLLVITLQCTYLVGLLFAVLWRQAKAKRQERRGRPLS
jgi:hypothetical protein